MSQTESSQETEPRGVDRRRLMQGLGAGLAGAAALGSVGLVASTAPAAAQALTDADVFNFALNLEYLEAEFYLRAVSGSGIPASLTGGVGTQGTVTGGSAVPFKTPEYAFAAQRIAGDELLHVAFLRGALGSAAVAEPTIDFTTSFTTAASAAGLISPGQTFNPFANEINFLLAAYLFEDVGVTAYTGALGVLTSPQDVTYAGSIAATEAYHAGYIRGALARLNLGAATDAISQLRFKLSGVFDLGTNEFGNPFFISNVDPSGQPFRRTPGEVLTIVYGGGTSSGLFYPNGVNGAITTSAAA